MTEDRLRAVAWSPAAGAFVATEAALPAPGPQDLLVAVAAASVNPVDVKLRAVMSPAEAPRILGFDACGTVVATRAEVTGFSPGDRVWYAGTPQRPGSNATHQLVDARIAARAPETLSALEAAALPLTLLTAWEALFERLGYAPPGPEGAAPAAAQPGPLLVINGAGGVGSVALQLARLAGIEATATAARPESVAWCRRMGAAEVVAHDALAALPESRFARILCCHDLDRYLEQAARLVAPQGLICGIAGAQGPVNIRPLFLKSAGVVWEYMFTRPTFATPDMPRQGAILAGAARLVDEGRLRSTLTTTLRGLTPGTLAAAHAAIASGRQIGKLAMAW